VPTGTVVLLSLALSAAAKACLSVPTLPLLMMTAPAPAAGSLSAASVIRLTNGEFRDHSGGD
jgi:hypothetical protein